MESNEDLKIVFDVSHANSVEIETSAYGKFIEYLFQQNIKIGKISGEITWDKLKNFNLLLLGNPNLEYSIKEIYTILEFMKNGGNIFILTDEGGDISNQTNLNDLAGHLGFKILPNIIYDSVHNNGREVHPIVKKFETHPITADISSIVLASGCSFLIKNNDDFLDYMDVSVKPVAFASNTAQIKEYKNRTWEETSGNDAIMIIAGNYFEGRFVCIGTPSILSSLSNNYGLDAKDNQKIIKNILQWLLEERENIDLGTTLFGEEVEVLVKIKKDIWNWTRSMASIGEWGDLSSIINYSLKLLKKNVTDKNKQLLDK